MSETIGKVTDQLKYIYGENLLKDGQPRRVTLTIKAIQADEFVDQRGGKTHGFSIAFDEAKKLLGVTGVTVTRQLVLATGTEDAAAMIGKKVVLYPVASKKSVSGWAVRIAPVQSSN